MEEDRGQWVFVQYEHLPNFCYVCGMLDHREKECMEKERGCEGNQEDDMGMTMVLGKEKAGRRKRKKRPPTEERL